MFFARYATRRARFVSTVIVILGCFTMTAPAQAIVNGYRPAPNDTRFDAVGAFGFTRWLDGTNQVDNWWGGATLISPTLIVTARHNLSSNPAEWTNGNYAVRFRRQLDGTLQHKADGGGFPFLDPVREWIVSPSGDIALGILQTPITHIQPIAADLNVPAVGEALILAGWGSESLTALVGNPRNELRLANTAVTSAGAAFVGFPSAFPTGSPATGAGPNLHDSGGAILSMDAAGNLHYRGVITTLGGGTGLGQYAGTRFGTLLLAAPAAQTIPEPSSLVLMVSAGLAAAGLFRRRRGTGADAP